ncbi:MAG: SDR family NAD(P)-dependent oxidoreductase [Porticoccaceae bacterium]|jgi:NAD(P)-dependent dehydrogenase (short-subunit alcohol dehydrogenase family)|nr:SDR family NAD(P)-dependent oxidoreductase [Porticoccaceae bacterium]MBT6780875.1 SDR family NAD(P)-dependent oxidoreductase [Porticoccaceae bacterium]MDG1243874.1 SDR family NAD(P)-dependent oxidoreductase [Porticoccaceae bacterium]MDG1322062.1 SDR family NAD(P)-dependent oxidoreductase [Porticoccaceae bacterium]MDG2145872.1 SDR family NAD(P)-dependent oxidoreductase [Porticoccaceae bacterium]
MTIRYDGQVAIVTGAGNGLGRSHALALASRGAKVVVNDLGGAVDGSGSSSEAALEVVRTIEAAGGEAVANGANVADLNQVEAMVAQTIEKWGRVDILVNNAGILRDKSFVKMTMEDFKLVVDVHLIGSANCTKAVWSLMREQGYGRIVMTTSSSGMYGNFGQSNYGAAKMAVVGLMNTLVLEGDKYDIKVNCLSPTAGTRMLDGLLTDEISAVLTVEAVTTGLLTLCDTDAPNRTILCAGAGGYARTHIYETDGIFLAPEDQTPENVRANMEAIENTDNQRMLVGGFQQTDKFVAKASAHFKNK